MSSIFIPLTLGFLGSFHCIGMCGPIALALPIGQWNMRSKIAGVLLYNMGRVLTYALIGLLFGTIGRGFSMVGLQQVLSVSLGVLIITLLLLPGSVASKLEQAVQHIPYLPIVKREISALFKQKTFTSLGIIGMLNGLLPCGFVYMALAGAVATGSTIDGALFMVFFGLGTIPAMLTVALSSQLFSLNIRGKIKKAVPVFMFMVGTILIVRGMNLGIPYMSPKFDDKGHVKRSCCQRHHSNP